MLTKIQAEIMKVFASDINGDFSIKQISERTRKPYPLIHRAVKDLVSKSYLLKDKRKILGLNYKKNVPEIAYIESLRTKERLEKDKTIGLFVEDVISRIKADLLVFLFFGSYIEKINPRDIDLLLILNNGHEVEDAEKFIRNLASNFSYKFDINVISKESAQEMLRKREEKNVLNETLNKHLIVFGAENYYRILSNARQ